MTPPENSSLEDFLDYISSQNPTEPLIETSLPLIVPALGNAYALDSEGRVVGIKLGYQHASQEALDRIMDFSHLQRLIFYTSVPVAIPASIADLSELRIVVLGGNVSRIPAEFFLLPLPVYSSEAQQFMGPVTQHSDDFMTVSMELKAAVRRFVGEVPSQEIRRDREQQLEVIIDSVVRTGGWGRGTIRQKILQSSFIASADQNPQEASAEIERIIKHLVDASGTATGVFLQLERLQDPPLEIVARGRDAVLRYFRAREDGDLRLNEVKVLVVGHGSSGKTSLVRRIFGERFNRNESQTHGINIRRWKTITSGGTEIKANLWDFGGQEIMHATHQFFLSKRSLYVVLLDGRKDEDAEYWLQHIESFGGSSPIFVVLNKIDEHSSFDVNRRFLQQKYPSIVGFHRVSCATDEGLSDFVMELKERLQTVPILQTSWPQNWFNVKEELESDHKAYISMTEYTALCQREGIDDAESQQTLIEFLNDLGVILHFPDLELQDTHVLDPRWVTEAVYRIINSPIVASQKGFLQLALLNKILKPWKGATFSYPTNKHRYIVDLMLKFELCYEVADDAVLLPNLLDVQQPQLDIEFTGPLAFVFQYAFLPRSVMPRFIVRMHRDIFEGKAWRTGVVLFDPLFGSHAIVTADTNAKRIEVFVVGGQARDYFATLRKALTEINLSFEKLAVTESVPLPDNPEELVAYQDLVGHELSGRSEIFIGRLGKSYHVGKLLGGIEDPESRHSSPMIINVSGDYIANSEVGIAGRATVTAPAQRSDDPLGGVRMTYQPATWERVVAFVAAFFFLGLIAFLAVRNEPIADPNIVVLIRIVLSVMVSVFGATIPGMLHVDMSRQGIVIRATGALALFVITFLLTPQVLG